jgi:hypothetical protein
VRQTLDGTAIDGVQTKVGQLGYFYNPFYGTSAAAPHVAAIAALVKQANPALSPAQVASHMAATATDLGAAGYDTTSGAGRYNALDAVYKVFMPPAPDLSDSSDSGISNSDDITNDATPTFEGTVPKGSFVRLYVDNVQVASQQLTVDAADYSITAPALSDGSHQIQIRVASSSSVPLANNSPLGYRIFVDIDTAAPTVMSTDFEFDAPQQRLKFQLSEEFASNVTTSNVELQNDDTITWVDGGDMQISLDLPNNRVYCSFPGFQYGALPDGDYSTTLYNVQDLAGNIVAPNIHHFFFLNGDANRDRIVNLQDFNIMAANFGQANRVFSQGNFNYDAAGLVSLQDFNLFAGKFGAALSPSMQNGGGGSIFGDASIGDSNDFGALEDLTA